MFQKSPCPCRRHAAFYPALHHHSNHYPIHRVIRVYFPFLELFSAQHIVSPYVYPRDDVLNIFEIHLVLAGRIHQGNDQLLLYRNGVNLQPLSKKSFQDTS